MLLAGAILLSAGLVTVHSYLGSRRSLLAISHVLIEQDALLVREQVRLFLSGLRTTAEATLRLLEAGLLHAEDPLALEPYLFQVLSAHSSLSNLGYGDEAGGFLMVARQPDGSLATKVVRRVGGHPQVRWRFRAPGASVQDLLREAEDPDDDFDPRVRPWYVAARAGRRIGFTDAYLFHSDRQPGLTLAAAHRRGDGTLRGVLMLDVSLRDLSRFVSNIQIGESGRAFLFDRRGALLAAPDGGALHVPGPQGPRLRQVSESERPEVAALGRGALFQSELAAGLVQTRTLRYEHGGRIYIAHLAPVTVDQGVRWGVGLIAAEEEFLGELQRTHMRNLATALGLALLFAAGGVLVARYIARSLEALVAETNRLRQLEFAASAPAAGPFREVDEVLQAFEHMKTGLRAFQKYVPVHLVRALLAARHEPMLGGEVRELTLFFSDIRGFTTISEALSPQDLAEKLARYLSVVTAHIHAHRGTVDKYMGDGVMAFWGAPEVLPDHARLACQAALRCQADLRELWQREPSFPRFATRIGLHTAEVLVGNFGSLERLNYTVLGDGVNLASRLEGLNEPLGTEILISEQTARRVADEMELRRVGLVSVRGRQHPLQVFELLGERGQVSAAHLDRMRRYEQALACYESQRFAQGAALLEDLLAEAPDGPARILLKQCRACEASPPPAPWTGSIQLGPLGGK